MDMLESLRFVTRGRFADQNKTPKSRNQAHE